MSGMIQRVCSLLVVLGVVLVVLGAGSGSEWGQRMLISGAGMLAMSAGLAAMFDWFAPDGGEADAE